jgi:hypothetical protein
MPHAPTPPEAAAPERTALLARLRQLERAARPLVPGTLALIHI